VDGGWWRVLPLGDLGSAISNRRESPLRQAGGYVVPGGDTARHGHNDHAGLEDESPPSLSQGLRTMRAAPEGPTNNFEDQTSHHRTEASARQTFGPPSELASDGPQPSGPLSKPSESPSTADLPFDSSVGSAPPGLPSARVRKVVPVASQEDPVKEALERFYRDVIAALDVHMQRRTATAQGSPTVVKRVALAHGLDEVVERLPLPRLSRAELEDRAWVQR
jgi:hypothetical protein